LIAAPTGGALARKEAADTSVVGENRCPGTTDWFSAVYLGKLSCGGHRYQSYVIFIVRDDREADLLFQCRDTTGQAYNKGPDSFSLYDSDPPR
jgi:hypothetical protein